VRDAPGPLSNAITEHCSGRERGREGAGELGKERVKRRGDERMTENTRQQEREAHAQMAMGAARMHRKFTYHNTQDAREEALVDE
jgi:hypothetical protein